MRLSFALEVAKETSKQPLSSLSVAQQGVQI